MGLETFGAEIRSIVDFCGANTGKMSGIALNQAETFNSGTDRPSGSYKYLWACAR
jgi:hypothetical protein